MLSAAPSMGIRIFMASARSTPVGAPVQMFYLCEHLPWADARIAGDRCLSADGGEPGRERRAPLPRRDERSADQGASRCQVWTGVSTSVCWPVATSRIHVRPALRTNSPLSGSSSVMTSDRPSGDQEVFVEGPEVRHVRPDDSEARAVRVDDPDLLPREPFVSTASWLPSGDHFGHISLDDSGSRRSERSAVNSPSSSRSAIRTWRLSPGPSFMKLRCLPSGDQSKPLTAAR
jgi:hypothetical protein